MAKLIGDDLGSFKATGLSFKNGSTVGMFVNSTGSPVVLSDDMFSSNKVTIEDVVGPYGQIKPRREGQYVVPAKEWFIVTMTTTGAAPVVCDVTVKTLHSKGVNSGKQSPYNDQIVADTLCIFSPIVSSIGNNRDVNFQVDQEVKANTTVKDILVNISKTNLFSKDLLQNSETLPFIYTSDGELYDYNAGFTLSKHDWIFISNDKQPIADNTHTITFESAHGTPIHAPALKVIAHIVVDSITFPA